MEPISFSDLSSRVLQLYSPPLRAKASFNGMSLALREFAKLTAATTSADLNTVNVARYVHARDGLNVNTTLSRLRCLRTASLASAAEGWIDRPPQWSRLMPRAVAPLSKRHLDHDQVVRLLDHLDRSVNDWISHRLYVMTALVVYTGLRSREASGLQLSDVKMAQGVLYVVGRRRLKTVSAEAPVPIADELAAVLARWLPEGGPLWLFPGVRGKGPWEGGAPGYRSADRLKAAAKAAGIGNNVTWHTLRHTLGKLYVGHFGGTADQARTLLRHSDVRTTEEYYLHRDDLAILRSIGKRISFRVAPPAS